MGLCNVFLLPGNSSPVFEHGGGDGSGELVGREELAVGGKLVGRDELVDRDELVIVGELVGRDELVIVGELVGRDELVVVGELVGRDELVVVGELVSRDELVVVGELTGGFNDAAGEEVDDRTEAVLDKAVVSVGAGGSGGSQQ